MFYWTQPPRSTASSDNRALTSFELVSLKPLSFWSLLSLLLLINNCWVQPLKALIHRSYIIKPHFHSSSAVQVGSSTLTCLISLMIFSLVEVIRSCSVWQLPGTDVPVGRGPYSWLGPGQQLLTENSLSPPSSAVLPGLSVSEQRQFLDDNLGCRPLKSLYTLFQICKCSFGYGSWSSFHEHPHSSAEKRVKSVIYQTHAEIAWFQFPCLPFLYAWNCLYHLCLCTIYIKMFFLSPVTNSVRVNVKTIPLTSKRAKRMQEKSEEKNYEHL